MTRIDRTERRRVTWVLAAVAIACLLLISPPIRSVHAVRSVWAAATAGDQPASVIGHGKAGAPANPLAVAAPAA